MAPSRILMSLGENVSEVLGRKLEEMAKVLDAYGADKYGGLAKMIDDFRAGKPGAEENLTRYLEDLRDEAKVLQQETPGTASVERSFQEAGYSRAQTEDYLRNEAGMGFEESRRAIDEPIEAADQGLQDPFPARSSDFGQENFSDPDFGAFGEIPGEVPGGVRSRKPSAYTEAYNAILNGKPVNWGAIENTPGSRALRDLYFVVKENPEVARQLKEQSNPGEWAGDSQGFYPSLSRGKGQPKAPGGAEAMGTPLAAPGLRKTSRERSTGLTDDDLYTRGSGASSELRNPEGAGEMRRIAQKLGLPPDVRFQELPPDMQMRVARELGFPPEPVEKTIQGVDIGEEATKGPAFRSEREAEAFFAKHPEMRQTMRDRFRSEPRTVEKEGVRSRMNPEEYEQLHQRQARSNDPFIGSTEEAAGETAKGKGRLATLLERQPAQDDHFRFEGAQELAESRASRLPGYVDEPIAEAKYATNAVSGETEKLAGLLHQKGFVNFLRELLQAETITPSEAARLREWAIGSQDRIRNLAETQAEELLTNQNWEEIARIFRWDNKRLNHMVRQFGTDPSSQERFLNELAEHFQRQVLAERISQTLGRRIGRRTRSGYSTEGALPPRGANAYSEQNWLDYYSEAGTPITNKQTGESRPFKKGVTPGQTYRPESEQNILRELYEGADSSTPVPRNEAGKKALKDDKIFDMSPEQRGENFDWLTSERANARDLQDEIIKFKDGSYTVRPQPAAWVPEGDSAAGKQAFYDTLPPETPLPDKRPLELSHGQRGNTLLPPDVEAELNRMRGVSEAATEQRKFSRKKSVEKRTGKSKEQAHRDESLADVARTQTMDLSKGELSQQTRSVAQIYESAKENAEQRLRRTLTREEDLDLQRWAEENIPLETRVVKNIGGRDLGRETPGRRANLLNRKER